MSRILCLPDEIKDIALEETMKSDKRERLEILYKKKTYRQMNRDYSTIRSGGSTSEPRTEDGGKMICFSVTLALHVFVNISIFIQLPYA